MTRPHTIVGSALATAVINVLVALVLIVALTPEAARIEPQKRYDQRLSIDCHRFPPAPIGAVPSPGRRVGETSEAERIFLTLSTFDFNLDSVK